MAISIDGLAQYIVNNYDENEQQEIYDILTSDEGELIEKNSNRCKLIWVGDVNTQNNLNRATMLDKAEGN